MPFNYSDVSGYLMKRGFSGYTSKNDLNSNMQSQYFHKNIESSNKTNAFKRKKSSNALTTLTDNTKNSQLINLKLYA